MNFSFVFRSLDFFESVLRIYQHLKYYTTYTIAIKYEYTYTRTHERYYTCTHILYVVKVPTMAVHCQGRLFSHFLLSSRHVSCLKHCPLVSTPMFDCTKTSERQDCIEIFEGRSNYSLTSSVSHLLKRSISVIILIQ